MPFPLLVLKEEFRVGVAFHTNGPRGDVMDAAEGNEERGDNLAVAFAMLKGRFRALECFQFIMSRSCGSTPAMLPRTRRTPSTKME